MPSKEQPHNNDKASSHQRLTKPPTNNSDLPALQQTHPSAIIQRARLVPPSLTAQDVLQLQRTIGNRAVGQLLAETQQRSTAQTKGADTGLPDNLKAGVETLSGIPMDDVKVHYDSAKPADLQALAYTQGVDIHMGPGQEKHLAHEAWHVAQQKQGRVNPTIQAKGVDINDDVSLEKEADVMGEQSARLSLPRSGMTGAEQANALQSKEGLDGREGRVRLNSLTPSIPVQRLKAKGDDKSMDLSALDTNVLLGILDNLKEGKEIFTLDRASYEAETGDLERVQDEIRRRNKRERTSEEEEPEEEEHEVVNPQGSDEIGEELKDWLASEGVTTSQYWPNVGPEKVHRISKGQTKDEKERACWNWALRALSDQGGPSPDNFWNYIIQLGEEEPGWMASIPREVKAEINKVMNEIRKSRLSITPETVGTMKYTKPQIAKAKELLTAASRILVQAHDFEIVSESEAAGWIVCQYKYKEGAAVPEHWWIELPGGVVIQTVPGVDIEIGRTDLRWHSESGRMPETAPEYGTIRIPVKALKGRHVEILKQGMAAEKAKQIKRRRTSRGRRGGR